MKEHKLCMECFFCVIVDGKMRCNNTLKEKTEDDECDCDEFKWNTIS